MSIQCHNMALIVPLAPVANTCIVHGMIGAVIVSMHRAQYKQIVLLTMIHTNNNSLTKSQMSGISTSDHIVFPTKGVCSLATGIKEG